jgi:DNA-3-methyladenine glycosylase I
MADPPPTPDGLTRCPWAKNALAVHYHDHEWGVPVHDDRRLFEFLVLEGAQAGLSWDTVLRRRDAYRAAFAGFDPVLVAAYNEARLAALLVEPGIVRNRAKLASAVQNARAVLALVEEQGSLDGFLWRFVDGAPRQNAWRTPHEVPATTPEAVALSRALRGGGFSFVGPTICYAFMQAVGMVNDHLVGCYRHAQLRGVVAHPL